MEEVLIFGENACSRVKFNENNFLVGDLDSAWKEKLYARNFFAILFEESASDRW